MFLKIFKFFFALKKLKKPPSKVAHLSRILFVSEIFHNAAQQPKCQKSCSKMWPIEQLYIELGYIFYQKLAIKIFMNIWPFPRKELQELYPRDSFFLLFLRLAKFCSWKSRWDIEKRQTFDHLWPPTNWVYFCSWIFLHFFCCSNFLKCLLKLAVFH